MVQALNAKPKMVQLKKNQVVVLKCLAEMGPVESLTRSQITERTGVSDGVLTSTVMGPKDEQARALRDEKFGYPSLLTLRYVRILEFDGDGEARANVSYQITDAGRLALKSLPQSNDDD